MSPDSTPLAGRKLVAELRTDLAQMMFARRLLVISRHLNPLARMTTIQSPSEACCSIPPVVVDYTEKGTYEPLGAFDRVYVTGDDKSETALIIVYDIFA